MFPDTVVYTSEWTGFICGCEDSFEVKVLPGYHHVSVKRSSVVKDIGYQGYQWVTPSVIGELRKFRPDVLFTSAFGLWTACALAYKMMRRSRVIVLLDGISETTAFKKSSLRFPVRRLMGKYMDAGVSNSQAGCDYLMDAVGIQADKVTHRTFYVPDATVLQSKAERETPIDVVARPNFLFIGQIIKRKGWNYLLDATRLLISKGLNTFAVNVVGDGPERELLMEHVLSRGLQDVVNVVGAIPYNRIGIYFESADVFILPSLEDTWGMVVSEAMAFGKAVLCSQYAGARELVHSGVNGYVFDPRNPAELAGYMEEFIRNRDLIARFGARSLEIIASHTPYLAAESLGRVAYEAFYGENVSRASLS
jgi:glycosyltransferase involved in cell wall biosynthesis